LVVVQVREKGAKFGKRPAKKCKTCVTQAHNGN